MKYRKSNDSDDSTHDSPEKSQAKPAGKSPLVWATIVGSLVCIGFSAYLIVQQFREDVGEDGLTEDERTRRDLTQINARLEKAVDDINSSRVEENLLLKGIEDPQLVAADEAKLSNSDRVIGVNLNGQARAYLLSGMSLKDSHIIHDQLGDNPLTVVYCDRSEQARVFHRTIEARKIRLAGFNSKQLILQIQGKRYAPSSKVIPLDELKNYEVTTWAEWKKKHPQSMVFAGQKRLAANKGAKD